MKSHVKLIFAFTLMLLILFSCSEQNEILSESNSLDLSPLGGGALGELYNSSSKNKIESLKLSDPRDCCGGILQEHIAQENLSFPVITNSFNKLYSFRNNLLNQGSGTLGEKYIKAYYELSGLIKNEKISINELVKLNSLLPELFNVYNKINNPNYKGIIINTNLRRKLLTYLDLYKSKKPNDIRYQNLLTAISRDVNVLTNRNREQIKGFLELR